MTSSLPWKKPKGLPSPEKDKAKGLKEIKGLVCGRGKVKRLMWFECADKEWWLSEMSFGQVDRDEVM